MKERKLESLSYDFLEKAFFGHMAWVRRNSLEKTLNEQDRRAHLGRAAELASIAFEKKPNGAQYLFSGAIRIIED